MPGAFESSDPRLGSSVPALLRGLQMCAHETFIDCPYYEQLMYVGDARLEALVTYAISGDDRLPRKAIALFDASRLASGLVQSRYPSRVRQVIPPFALWWIGMVHDFAMWRADEAFVRSMMPGVRAVIEAYQSFRNADGLVEGPATGWNYVDWVPGWKNGVPPDGDYGVSAVVNWQFAYVLRLAWELEEGFGEPELAARCDRLSREVAAGLQQQFWEPVRGLFADDLQKTRFSEHVQCLAILSGLLEEEQCAQVGDGLLNSTELARTTIYFTHYLFEAYRVLGVTAEAALFERLSLWFDLGKHGFVTPFEEPEPSRSDCHGWGAHPLFHFLATVLGVRPGAAGFASVEVRPHLGRLTEVRGSVPHARGRVGVELRREGKEVRGVIRLPEGVRGNFVFEGRRVPLQSGENVL
jgi:alpha-L-rhamnosidase